jgi:hypothetical protein
LSFYSFPRLPSPVARGLVGKEIERRFGRARSPGYGLAQVKLRVVLLSTFHTICGRGESYIISGKATLSEHPRSLRQPPDRIAKEHTDGRFPRLAIRRGGLGVAGPCRAYAKTRQTDRRLLPLVKEGFTDNLTEAATRFAISRSAVATILVGMATPQKFEDALPAVQKGPLPSEALNRLSGLSRPSLASYDERGRDLSRSLSRDSQIASSGLRTISEGAPSIVSRGSAGGR